ncbi:adenylyl-sulfate kinase [Candidatus Fermentibacteria bacterium]|nr:adenylyl-sulfate kinase [Candidatus Fermentibacteria bacterium]
MLEDDPKSQHITWHHHHVTRADRERLLGHRGATVWLTGLSGSGKSTIADALAARLHDMGVLTAILDGDNVRHGLNRDLGFSPEDRKENIRRIAEVAKLFSSFGVVNILAFISPYREDRDFARSIRGEDDFLEVYVKVPLEVAEERDPKGLYAKARSGEIPSFTGISAPYEEPLHPELVLDTDVLSPEEGAERILVALAEKNIIDYRP